MRAAHLTLVFIALCAAFPAVSAGESPADPRARAASLWRVIGDHVVESELGVMGANDPDHTLRSQRRIHFRLFSFDEWFMDVVYEEELLWGFAFEQVNHTFDYFRAGRKFGPVSAFLYWNHTCNNIVHDRGVNRMHWNDIGIELTTDGAPGAWQESWYHLRARSGPAFLLDSCKYRWISQIEGSVRAASPDGSAMFARISLDVVADDFRVTMCPTLEIGFSVPVGPTLWLEPFLRLHRRRDAIGFETPTDTWLLGGIRLVHRVRTDIRRDEWTRSCDSLRLTAAAGYAACLFPDRFGYLSSVGFRLAGPGKGHLGKWFAEFHGGINTPAGDMFPNLYAVSAGPSADFLAYGARLRASYRYRERRAVGFLWRDPNFKCVHELKLDFSPSSRLEEASKICASPDTFDWGFSLSWFPARNNFPWQAGFSGFAQVRLVHFGQYYVSFRAETAHFAGAGAEALTGAAVELSLHLPGFAGEGRMYLRVEESSDPFRNDRGRLNLLGFDVNF